MPFIEAPTTFYMGRRYDPNAKRLTEDVVYYDSRDLTTHAVVVGMTGSGKTGMCISLLEEAVLDNIPAICIDPKGDITNLLLSFPNLRPEDFEPWINIDDARRTGLDVKEYSADVAQQWRDGLASWSIVPPRIAAMKNAAQFSIYTPGSDAGLPISILDSLRAPAEGWTGNDEALRERISGIVTALMALIGKQVDPVRDREHVLISNIFENAWKAGQNLTLEDIILQVQKPPFAKLGVFDVNTFFPEKDRFKLAKDLNQIIAAPSFQSWISGEALDINHLLYTPEGRPRVSIFYLAHLTEAERTFIITLLLENMLAWMRSQSGTTSLRGLLYFDEVFGHFPPAPRNPPTKEPLLRLLKQGRAFGIGVILATQNPGDLDYKGLSNAGTWFIGKLQTDNDKKKVLAGLQGAATAESEIDIDTMNKLLSQLAPRVFVVHNVHEHNGPTLMHTRWTMSYLAGPLTRQQIRVLMEPQQRALGLLPAAQPGQAPVQPAAPLQPLAQVGTPAARPNAIPNVPPTPYANYVPPAIPRIGTPAVPPSAAPPANLPEGAGAPPPGLPESPAAPASLPGFPPTAAGQPAPAVPRHFFTPAATTPPENSPVYQTPPPPAYTPPVPPAPPAVPPPAAPSYTAPGPKVGSAGIPLPDGYHNKPPALPSSQSQYYLPMLITAQQAFRDWENKQGVTVSAFVGPQLLYQPILLAQVMARYMDRKTGLEDDQRWAFHIPNLDASVLIRWSDYAAAPVDPAQVGGDAFGEAYFGPLNSGLTDTKRLTSLKSDVVDYVYRSAASTVLYNSTLDMYAKANENRRDYLLRVQQKARESRDAEIDTTTAKYDAALQKLEDKLKKESQGAEYDERELKELKREGLYTTGEAVFGLARGRPGYSLSRMSRARIYRTRAEGRVVANEQQLTELENEIDAKQAELQQALKDVNDKWAKIAATVEEVKVTPLKKDIALEIFGIGWFPSWQILVNGQSVLLPAYPTDAK